jgi:hypothetical protein
VHWIDGGGRVRALGLDSVTPVAADGGVVTRVVAPGLALRLVPGAWRYGIGYQESTIYQGPPGPRGRDLLALGDLAYGVAFDLGGVVVGAERRFFVVTPEGARPVVQEIRYRSGRPAPDWLHRKEGE